MDLNEEIARVAYELWEKRGRGPDKDDEDWYKAEIIVRAQYGQPHTAAGETEEDSMRTEKTASEEAPVPSVNEKITTRSKREKQGRTSKK